MLRIHLITPFSLSFLLPLLPTHIMLRRVTSFVPRMPALSRRTFSSSIPVVSKPDMFCFQCEQTEGGSGCTTLGVCGKTPETAAIQDLLVHSVRQLSPIALDAQAKGIDTSATDELVLHSLFSTLTNVNFDSEAVASMVTQLHSHANDLQAKAGTSHPLDAPGTTVAEMESNGRAHGVLSRGDPTSGDDTILGLGELVTYGVKGLSAYAAHARTLGAKKDEFPAFVYKAFSYVNQPKETQTVDGLLGLALECGKVNLDVMGALNGAHTDKFGVPVPTSVRTTPVEGKCILISGHDLGDTEALLEQTAGTGVNVYTHGELLPAHGYPELKKHEHLVGNYGGAWQLQKLDFAMFPGPVVMTSNCIVEPGKAYADRIYTMNDVGFPGVPHVKDRDFSGIIAQAQGMDGFTSIDASGPEKHVTTGWSAGSVLGAAPLVLDAIKGGKLSHFFLVGGCDGSEGERSYYKKLVKNSPTDTAVLTLGCAKYRFNKLPEMAKTIPGTDLPRLLDVGQCNDAYDAVKIAVALAEALDMEVNDLPLSIVLSWFEQKAVAVLLSLLHLGIKDMHIGPELPAFVTPAVLDVLVTNYGLTPIGDAKDDMAKLLGQA